MLRRFKVVVLQDRGHVYRSPPRVEIVKQVVSSQTRSQQQKRKLGNQNGHDHDDDAEAEAMESGEIAVLAKLGIADPYAGTDPLHDAAEAG